MDRRGAIKVVCTAIGGLFVRGRKNEMSEVSRLFQKLGVSANLTPHELASLEMYIGETKSVGDLVRGWSDIGSNNPSFDHLVARTGEFEVLPHDSSAMVRSTNQTIPDGAGTITPITFTVYSSLTANLQKLAWTYGVETDTTTGEFFLKGIPENSLWLFSADVIWDGAPGAMAAIYLYESGHTSDFVILAQQSGLATMGGVTLVKTRKSAESWQLGVTQQTGGNHDIAYAACQVMRLR